MNTNTVSNHQQKNMISNQSNPRDQDAMMKKPPLANKNQNNQKF